MEIVKELPEIFEEFSDQRRKSFLAVKEIKDRGIPVVGSYCTYFPKEIAVAAGAVPISLCSMSDEPIPDAEKELPKNLCPLIKSSYGFAKTDKCPYFHFSDVVVGETTCDGKKKMYEYMREFKDIITMQLPQTQDEDALEAWEKEIRKLAAYLEQKFGTEVTEEKLRAAVKQQNAIRQGLKELSGVMKADPTPMSGLDLFNVLYGSQFKFDLDGIPAELSALKEQIRAEYDPAAREKKPRILITGCPMGGATLKVVRAVEENGGVVVCYENCSGYKSYDRMVDEQDPDVWHALAERYLSIGCSVMTPNPNRLELLGRLCDEFHVDGVLEMTLSACHTYNLETHQIRNFVTKEKGLPFFSVETDYSQADIGQLNTRIAAFIEML
ncbi:Benzoyl-CoA reductase/2-hydroxyglutaryl-CoA dehydratase subunit, BcrC/BadD/HgdB [Eubacterium pyruvativorans]|uniref:Benzoyl-CoA reductase/2-hydroxyglutaryl-CoA dehydratase subunit, BcrC/BadD/HgdB n=1 Tax=Eubacterium pyruvativorans TaxID=155865 RepID=A0A1I7FCM1_9FIRM|nr:double-cubane-cluster-containing anaerobic reductase [Eubacterium pyruvativorans]MDD6708349.1 double-cubane-cluster-containing anaerobic reductase [Eubacterium pyruvativorans]SDE96156.1 Benzoyl-CoA reductase/2-hydroxyglutaryl-CoA dehydratase subunit, BcrC/BadD/HgdB [Eubacterium pyruvativorans]SFN85846.1 Benzoyl-CoA reductase/2-hydroxyglutaryl-CoA dehydratase subunit, BcrC/BadD/HgdB [Eubacterium pyruvativorans]SFU33908.1 Benzoyl-CoA reductase/2-hydroxyglutaryl-CoA dehydratase subunit, BcrC/Ba